jgi:GT2 family glycosyltransferase
MPVRNWAMKIAGVGAVVIGRNEGVRLVRCLESLRDQCDLVVYVDSNSTDDSVAQARALGAHVVVLDAGIPFTAARARNAGFRALLEHRPDCQHVQFVDGDCEVMPGWLPAALDFMRDRPRVAVVCGRRRERHPEASIYNQLCDLEWDTPVGAAKSCGGDALMRAAVLQQVGGYRESLIAGEEPELCVRIRGAGWQVWRLDAEMTLHDAAITRFGQWWRRTVRAGHAFAEGAWLHGDLPERHWVRETVSALAWGLGIPATVVVLAVVFHPGALALLGIYGVQWLRLHRRAQGTRELRVARATTLLLGKFAECWGALQFGWRLVRGGPVRLIEYK